MSATAQGEQLAEAIIPGVNWDRRYQSWGRFPKAQHRFVHKVWWRDQIPALMKQYQPGSLLPYGCGRSYGDSCLNIDRDLMDCRRLDRILDFNPETGRIRVESGITLADLLEVIVPRGWFLPVTPGTKHVTIGGAIANDVHGKNHHRAGTFGSHVRQITLYRSDAGELTCSEESNRDLFRATIGGLGLTGVIGSADLQLKRISGNALEVQTMPFECLEQFLSLSADADRQFEYTVAWVDCLAGSRVRGIFLKGNHVPGNVPHRARTLSVPFAFPEWVLNRTAVSLFNRVYYRRNTSKEGLELVHYDPFFYPLDGIRNWNLLYGKRGLVQYQCVVPRESPDALRRMLALISAWGEACFLGVLKVFGSTESPGLLSFPRPGLTLALDLPMRGERTLKLLDSLDEIVLTAGGALYPAKDARMSRRMFAAGFPKWKEFSRFTDPALSSSFWRRVADDSGSAA